MKMSNVKWSGAAWRGFWGLAVFVAASTAALADTTTLVCNATSPYEEFEQDEPTTIQLNEAQSSVVVHYASSHAKPGSGISGGFEGRGGGPPMVVGPLPAVFGTDTITFTYTMGGYVFNGVINRLTGTFGINAGAIVKWTCQPGQKQF